MRGMLYRDPVEATATVMSPEAEEDESCKCPLNSLRKVTGDLVLR